MTSQFKAEVFQNQYLPQGFGEIHAIMTITSEDVVETSATSNGDRLFGIICDTSGSMQSDNSSSKQTTKILAAKQAIIKLIQLMPENTYFFVVTGASDAKVIVPVVLATPHNKERAINLVRNIDANGTTAISTWLAEALAQFNKMPNAIRQALLLTDGQNDKGDDRALLAVLERCEGVFQCDCRGVGTDWKVAQLQQISHKLLGTTDIIPDAQGIEADFQQILLKAMSKNISDVNLRLWTPQGARTVFCKQVSPDIVDLTGRGKSVKPQIVDYPTGSWGKGESRDYHFCIEVQPGKVGDEMLAGRASLIYTLNGVETKITEAKILAIWTDEEAKSTKIDRRVAHYTGQAELAHSIQEGLEARAQGNFEVATAKLGKAVQLAHQSGNEATAKLLRKVVDVEDANTGTVRLKREVAASDAMALETRSTKTTRIPKSNQ
ncbi:VWA domain-containing protein [Phormidium sp. LEGE 05292]|uniref:vWA domain-containing protein n=1 Tax=[Phormidium] sp. LEGE 05292 TaxID=767427 RepID=UPI001880A58F|nr:VWA domain-containing protein [Phormidium sp. LEGE 05292]MBE9228836.1 VWA domain-containing protein [Phormidium sp. LEGE 05292]